MKLAILGATGAVGQEILSCMKRLNLKVDDIVLLASARSAGKELDTPLGKRTVQEVNPKAFEGIDYAIFSAGGDKSKEWAPVAVEHGCVVIDNSSAFRYDDDKPLVVPEINGEKALGAKIIANPNCTTAIAAMVTYPIYKAFGIEKMIIATYQSTSGAGAKGMWELLQETENYFKNRDPGGNPQEQTKLLNNKVFTHPIPFNIIPCIDAVQDNGYTKEEMKVNWETKKIFGDDSLKISCTCVRIPVLRVHCESIVIETAQPVTPEKAAEVLQKAPGVELRNDVRQNVYPMPLTAGGKFEVEVGRIRQNLVFGEKGIELFVAGDQLLRGAALNALNILRYLIDNS